MRAKEVFSKLHSGILSALFFLIPLFFLPFFQNVLDFPKYLLFSFFVFLATLFLLIKNFFEGKVVFWKNQQFYFLLFLIFLTLCLSTFFSLDKRASFFGYPFEVSDSFLSFFLFFLFLILLFNSFEKKTEFLNLPLFLIFSGAILSLFNIFQLYKIYLLPFSFLKNPSFTLIGSQNSFALFCALLFPLSLIFALESAGISRKILGISSFLLLLNILLINFPTAWVVLGVEVLFLFLVLFPFKISFKNAIFFLLIFIVCFFFYFFPQKLPFFPTLSPEISLSLPAEIFIIKQTFSQNLKNIFLGTGPQTFSFDYSLSRPVQINNTPFWGTRFLKGYSLFFDWLLTKGIIFWILILILFFFAFKNLFQSLPDKKEEDLFETKAAFFACLLGTFLAFLFYPFNFSLLFLMWFFVATAFFLATKEKKEYSLSSPSFIFFYNFKFALLFLIFVSVAFWHTKTFLSEYFYFKGIVSYQQGDFEKAINNIKKATFFNSFYDYYWRDLAQAFLARANFLSQKEDLSLKDKQNLITQDLTQGADALSKAISLNPHNVANWNVRGFFYQNLIGLGKAGEIALESYQRAIQLEPNSPFSWTEKGRTYILLAQDFAKKGDEKSQKDYLNFAISILQKALELKPDFALAHYLLAVAYDQLGQVDKALEKLQQTQLISPQDITVTFQLGMLYFRKGDYQKAKEQFERAISFFPDYSNAHYMLALVFEKLGEKEKAISEMEKVEKLNPQNQKVKEALEKLKRGVPLSETPLFEQPSEIRR